MLAKHNSIYIAAANIFPTTNYNGTSIRQPPIIFGHSNFLSFIVLKFTYANITKFELFSWVCSLDIALQFRHFSQSLAYIALSSISKLANTKLKL